MNGLQHETKLLIFLAQAYMEITKVKFIWKNCLSKRVRFIKVVHYTVFLFYKLRKDHLNVIKFSVVMRCENNFSNAVQKFN